MATKKIATRVPMITSKRVGFDKATLQKMVLGEPEKSHELFHIVGSATQAIVKESQEYEDRESVEFRGSFLAINALTGEHYRSGKLYLPSLVEAELASIVQDKGMVQIVLTVTAEFNEDSGTSYVFGAKSHNEEDTSVFDDLLAKIPGFAIEAPKEAEQENKGGKKSSKKK